MGKDFLRLASVFTAVFSGGLVNKPLNFNGREQFCEQYWGGLGTANTEEKRREETLVQVDVDGCQRKLVSISPLS